MIVFASPKVQVVLNWCFLKIHTESKQVLKFIPELVLWPILSIPLKIFRYYPGNFIYKDDIIFFSYLGSVWIYSLRNGKRCKFSKFKGARPLVPYMDEKNNIYFGEYFPNKGRDKEVKIFVFDSTKWQIEVFYEFQPGLIRHIHGIAGYNDNLIVTSGDYGSEARFTFLDKEGNLIRELFGEDQLHRAVSILVYNDNLFYGTDTQIDQNYFCSLALETGYIRKIHALEGPVFYMKRFNNWIYFSSGVEVGLSELNRLKVYRYSLQDESIELIYEYYLPFKLNKLLQLLFGIPYLNMFETKSHVILLNNYFLNVFSKNIQLSK